MFGLNNKFPPLSPTVCSGLSVIGLTPVLLIFWVVSVHSMDCLSISDSHGSNKRDNTIWQQAECSEEDETQTFPGGTLCGPSANVFTCLREDDWCSVPVCVQYSCTAVCTAV